MQTGTGDQSVGVAEAVEGDGLEPNPGADLLGLRIQSPTSGWKGQKPLTFLCQFPDCNEHVILVLPYHFTATVIDNKRKSKENFQFNRKLIYLP